MSCDLFAVPAGLTALVARAVRGEHLAPEELIIAATHSHQGPGNYMSAAVYNEFGSDESGFDRSLLDFLADRVAEAIRAAVHEARAHINDLTTQVFIRQGTASTELRNRAPRVFLLNWDRDRIMDSLHPRMNPCIPEPGEPSDGWDLVGCPRLRATDPSLTVIDIRRGNRGVGLLAFFAAHPTILRHSAPLFSSDFVGIAMLALEASGDYPVAGFFNGAEGDITPRRLTRDLHEARSFGLTFRDDVLELLQTSAPAVAPSVATAQSVSHPDADPACDNATLARRPEFGVATLGGGEDDRTILYDLGWREGVRGVPMDGQGPKQPGLDSKLLPIIHLTGFLAPTWKFPETVPVSLAHLGPMTIAAVPGEFTTAAGRAVRRQLADLEGTPESAILLVGLANEYLSYTTTDAEYVAQDYSGASVIWGPLEQAFVSCRLRQLAVDPPRHAQRTSAHWFLPGSPRGFGPSDCGEARTMPDEELEDILLDSTNRPARQLPWIEWDEDRRTVNDREAPFKRQVSLLEFDGAAWKPRISSLGEDDDDRGANFLTLLLDGTKPRRRWAAIWIASLWESTPGRYAIRVHAADGSDHCSVEFTTAGVLSQEPRALQEMTCPAVSSLAAQSSYGGSRDPVSGHLVQAVGQSSPTVKDVLSSRICNTGSR